MASIGDSVLFTVFNKSRLASPHASPPFPVRPRPRHSRTAQTPTPLELFEGQDTQSAAITFCQTHNIAQSPPLVQQLAQLLQTRLRESKTVEPALSMGIAVGDSEAILEHYDGQDPTGQ